MANTRRVLLAAYGGGHVQSLIPVIQRLRQRSDLVLDVIGFTTALVAFERAGIPARGYSALLTAEDERWLELAREHKPADDNPNIAEVDSLAYHALGLRDLVGEYGEAEALARYAEQGRKAFLPVSTFRRYLRKTVPDLVITSTSPRSELALQNAANDLGISGLAISDLFLQNESDYLCNSRYAPHIAVIAQYVADFLVGRGCVARRLHVTGNPAFDGLIDASHRHAAEALRNELGLHDVQRLILWVCASASVSMIGKPFVEPERMLDFLEDYCASRPDTRFIVRQHPNHPVVGERELFNGVICPSDVTIETCIHLADVVFLETSTVGLQAALVGKPVVTFDAGDYPPYAKLELATDVADFDSAAQALDTATPPNPVPLGYVNLGTATEAIVTLIDTIL